MIQRAHGEQAWLWALPGERLGEMIGLKSKREDIGTGGPRSARRGPEPHVPVQPGMLLECICSLQISNTCKEAGGSWMLGMG